MKRLLMVLTLCLILLLNACAPSAPAEKTFWYMDTAITVRLYGDAALTQTALSDCNSILSDVDCLLSATREDSPIARFNASEDGRDVILQTEALELIEKSLDISRICGGAFDITTAPLSALWKQCEQDNVLPTAEQLNTVFALLGSEHLHFDASILIKDDPAVQIDLGGIGKGYAIDCLLAKLSQTNGITGALISMGSNVAVLGEKPDGSPWKIALRNPNDASCPVGYLHLTEGQILSVSGDYERYFTIMDQQYSHILDPHTGYPPANSLRSVAVLCSDGATADALSTALMVMGEEAARALYEHDALEFEAVFIYDGDTGVRVSMTQGIKLH